MNNICKKVLVSAALFLGLLPPVAATAAPPELLQFPEGPPGSLGGQLAAPGGIAANSATGHVYIGEIQNNRVSQFTAGGEFVRAWGWGVVRSGPGNKPSNERQEVITNASSGSFALVLSNPFADANSFKQATGPLPFDATAAEIQAALEGLPSLAPGAVAVTGPAGGPWTIEFTGITADMNVDPFEIADSTLSGTPAVETLQEGGNFEICEADAGDVCRRGQMGTYEPGVIATPRAVATDDSGNVYVSEVQFEPEVSLRVQKFSPEGEFLLMIGGEVNKTTGADVCTKAAIGNGDICGAAVAGNEGGELGPPNLFAGEHIDIGPDQQLYVGDNERIVVYSPDGVYQKEIAVEGWVRALALDASGELYVSYEGVSDIKKITPGGSPSSPASFPVPGEPTRAISLDASGRVFAIEDPYGFSNLDLSPRVVVFDAFGNKEFPTAAEIKKKEYFAQQGEATLGGLENLLCDGGTGNGALYVTDFSAHVTAYGEDHQCSEGAGPPAIDAQRVLSVSAEGAVLAARINPGGTPTTYYLEYGTADCSANPCAQQPAAPGLVLGGEGNVVVATEEIELTGLEPGTTYHFRFVAENGEVTNGPDRTFTTPRAGADGMLDGRSYEMVSPVDKNSGEAVPKGGTGNAPVHSSPDGNRLVYTATTPFGDPPAAPPLNYYFAQRGSAGWSSRNFSPPIQNSIRAPVQGFSRDLSHYAISVAEPVLCCGATPDVWNLYVARSDGGPLQLATEAAPQILPAEEGGYCIGFGGASEDFSRVFFHAKGALTGDSLAGSANLYEWSAADGLKLVSILPDGTPAPPDAETHFGEDSSECLTSSAAAWRHRAISDDGSHAVWTYGGEYEGAQRPLLARVDGTDTVQLDAPQGVSGPGGEGEYLGASADGSKVFFNSPEKLTADAVGGGNQGELYRYDFDAAPGERLANLTPSAGAAEVQGQVGTAADGGSIYFVATGALSSNEGASLDPKTGEPQRAKGGESNLYLWQEGEGVRFISRLGESGGSDGDGRNWSRGSQSHIGEVTPDGEHALLLSREPLTGYENLAADGETRLAQAYLYDAAEHRLTCASCNPSGAQPGGEAALTTWKTIFGVPRVLSDDGRRVFFESFDALTENDRNDARDVYEFERAGKGSCTTASPSYQPASEGCLALVSAGREGGEDSYFLDASTSGDDVFISTIDQLVGADEDELYDVYDARVGGGFPEAPPPPPGCEGEACLGPGTGPPAGPGPATATFSGPANRPRLVCPKGKVARKGRCVRKKVRCPKGKVARKGRCVKKKGSKAKQHRAGDKRRAAQRAGGNR